MRARRSRCGWNQHFAPSRANSIAQSKYFDMFVVYNDIIGTEWVRQRAWTYLEIVSELFSSLLFNRCAAFFSVCGRKSVNSVVSSVYWERQIKEISSRDTQNQVFFLIFGLSLKTSQSTTFSATTNSDFCAISLLGGILFLETGTNTNSWRFSTHLANLFAFPCTFLPVFPFQS